MGVVKKVIQLVGGSSIRRDMIRGTHWRIIGWGRVWLGGPNGLLGGCWSVSITWNLDSNRVDSLSSLAVSGS